MTALSKPHLLARHGGERAQWVPPMTEAAR
ncbi:hypothetical protein SAMN05216467_3317 [Cellulomonas sp. KH9]|nr:hypothetical protein SAMN05216467_3317 [Cellulomonas sp. KH9]